MQNDTRQIWLVYDGECPLCRTFAKALKIRAAAGTLHFINAREPHPLIAVINQKQLNLDQGIVVMMDDVFYHGSDALHVLAMLGTHHDWLNRVNALVFRSRLLSTLCYPVLKAVRNLLLWRNGINRINNLDNNHE